MNHGLFISHQVLDALYESPLIGSIAESAELTGISLWMIWTVEMWTAESRTGKMRERRRKFPLQESTGL